jgi:hypothetical protein
MRLSIHWRSFQLLINHLEKGAALLALGHAAVLVEQAEGALLGLVALAGQVLESLATGCLLLAAYNAAVLVLDEVGLDEATGGVLSSSVENLGLGANSRDFGHLILRTRFLVWGPI